MASTFRSAETYNKLATRYTRRTALAARKGKQELASHYRRIAKHYVRMAKRAAQHARRR